MAALAASFHSGLNRLGPLVSHHLNQPEFVRSFCLRPPESGNEFGMGGGWVHWGLCGLKRYFQAHFARA